MSLRLSVPRPDPWSLGAWAVTMVVLLAAVVLTEGQQEFRRFGITAAWVATAMMTGISLSGSPQWRGVWLGLAAGAALMLTLLTGLSIGIFLVPGTVLWWVAVSRQARRVGWTAVGSASVLGFGLAGVVLLA